MSEVNGFAIVQSNITGKFGFINQDGIEICPLIYDRAWSFDKNYGIVSLNGKEDYIDHNGNILFDFKYDDVHRSECGYIMVLLNKKHYIINFDGNIILEVENILYDISSNLNFIKQKENIINRSLKIKSFYDEL